ncbi:MAG: nitrogen regulation protein NR(I) [Wenzhouxiangellaceae bacterium]|nr:nitrogen regulation protein NR(I) [Wenzhouxiangellaceae bacterium]
MSTSAGPVWIVDDDASIRKVLQRALEQAGFQAQGFERAEDVLEALIETPVTADVPAVVLSDLRMPGMDGRALLVELKTRRPTVPVIIMTAYADLDSSVDLLAQGAFDLLPKPFELDRAADLVQRAMQRPMPSAEDQVPTADPQSRLIGRAPAMVQLFRTIGRLAATELGVLLIGESGTGKEQVARALHENSPRAKGPFVAINVAAIPAELLESELFGHEKGAFSGADRARAGHFEQAAGGTLLLDEIGDMPAGLQTRLLRVLAEGDFYRLGSTRPQRADVRLIAATHHDLADEVARGRFREDLYHRLDVVQLRLPPLRERREDIAPLLDHYLAQAARETGQALKTLSREALACLEGYDWPGNIRELVNLCRRLSVLVPGPEITVDDLPMAADQASSVGEDWQQALRRWARQRLTDDGSGLMQEATDELERCLIDEAISACNGRIGEAATRLGIGRNTLARKLGSR